MESMIQTEHLRKEFDGHIAVENLSMTVARGDVHGLIGPNGAGKTTLLRMLATLERPTFGRIRIGGIDAEEDPRAIHRLIGYMPDFHQAQEELTVREFMEFFAAAYRLDGATLRKRVEHILDLTSLRIKEHDAIGGLSRGMKQRLCLGRVLIHDPAVLLLDEPTSGLDPRARIEFRNIVKRLAGEGKTILISSHILEDLADFCNAVGILERGRLLRSGRIATILADLEAQVELRVRLLGDVERVAAGARELAGVTSVEVQGDCLMVGFRGGPEEQTQLLAGLVSSGARVLSFGECRSGIEEIFLKGSTHEVS